MMKKQLIVGLTTIGLSAVGLHGCLGAFVVGAATGGLVAHEKRHLKDIGDDQTIRYRIREKLTSDLAFKHSHISLMTFNKRVLLVGQTPNPALKQRAETIVRRTPGVHHVYNQIVIGPVTQPVIRSNDAWITTKAKSLLLAEKGLAFSSVKVITEDGVVFLMGLVTHKQAEAAVEVVRQVAGVRKVVKVFETVQDE